ncbi:type II toxin-antitoxin system Phd/YefM family antitoxin [Nocardia sp. XZ_19_385]|uniref:type II toxin-antitoxin system Phd/YefM family antitoxin n=1 Tax=Nocardia sp. XZ_19_385 TaxID=2769488 RepID=UPI001E4D8D1B|nr:type II toxin-antitoxin system prevent-host-death family antitoxin [Nocardia sp. XZ_19_385]
MRKVSVREFSYNPSAIFAAVEQGETIEVTKHGKTIAVIGPPAPAEKDGYDRLVEQGILIPPKGGRHKTAGDMLDRWKDLYKDVVVDHAAGDAAMEQWDREEDQREELLDRLARGEDPREANAAVYGDEYKDWDR